jgi:DNA-binding transcriptional LysR family regulator
MNALVQVPDVEDLTLVLTLHRTQSLGSAARELLVSQPAASQRLSRLERRCGTALFARSPLGTTATPAGLEMVRQAEHILGHLHGVFAAVRSSAAARTLRVGTFAGISGYAFPALDELVGDTVRLATVVHHGAEMIELVAEGSMDAALIGIAEQVQLPPHVIAHRLGTDELVAFVASGVEPPRRGGLPFLDRVVTYAPYDNSGPLIAERIAALGGTPRHAATAPVALEISRRRDGIAIVPSSAARMSGRPGDRVMASRVDLPVRLSVIARGELDPVLAAALPALAKALGLRRRTS